MAHSLEARTPFLDHRVVGFAATVADRLKLRSGTGKWMRGPLRATLADVLDDDAVARWPGLDGAAARHLAAEHAGGRRNVGLALFNLASTLLFLRAHG